MRIFISALLFFVISGQMADAQDKSVDYARQVDTAYMRNILEVLTSDSLEGRETGFIGQQRAASFLASTFRSFGLESASQDTFQYHHLSNRANRGFTLVANQTNFCFGKDFYYLSGQPDSTYELSDIFFIAPAQDQVERKPLRMMAGKPIICFQTGKNKQHKSNEAALEALQKFSEYAPNIVFIVTDSFHDIFDSLSRAERRSFPVINKLHNLPFKIVWMKPEVMSAMNKRLVRKLSGSNKTFQSIVIKNTLTIPFISDTRRFYGQNVPFFIRGSEKPEEVIVVNAHYDHLGIESDTIHYGADDDASGTTTVVETARLFSKAAKEGQIPRRSILFMPVSGEEKGLLGSLYYSLHPLFPLENTVADVNIDMVGRTDPEHDSLGIGDYVYVIGSDMLSSQLREINDAANLKLPRLELDYRFDAPDDPNRFYYRSDHYNFAKQGIPSVFYFNGVHKDYHQPTDTPDKIRYDLLMKRSQLVFLTIWELAFRDKRIVVDRKPVNNR